jgi:hypothetical protein
MNGPVFPKPLEADQDVLFTVKIGWESAQRGMFPYTDFPRYIELHAPRHGGEKLFVAAVKYTYTQESTQIMRVLIDLGLKHYPDTDWLQRAKRILIPARVVAVTPAKPGFAAAWAWIREHGHLYRGKYLALRGGELIACASTYDELIEILAPQANDDTIEKALV